MANASVIIIGNISIDGGPARPAVMSGIASSAPLSIWGGGGVGNYPDAGFPGPQPGGPIGIWGGGGVGNYPDAGLPGPQPRPPFVIWGPGSPSIGNPIAGIPGLPGYEPPGGIGHPPGGGGGGSNWKWVYSPVYGWVLDPGSGGKPQPPGEGNGDGDEQSSPST